MRGIVGFLVLCVLISYLGGWGFWNTAGTLIAGSLIIGALNAAIPTRVGSSGKGSSASFVADNRQSRDAWEERRFDPTRLEKHGGKSRDDLPPDGTVGVKNARVGIEAREWGDEDSERYIVPASFSYRVARDGRVFVLKIEAFCELRHEHRTFRYHRIRNAYDVETGEILNNLGEFLWSRRQED